MTTPSQAKLCSDYDRYNWTPPEGAEHLPGFVEGRDPVTGYGGVTFESHQFWVEFSRRDKIRPDAVIYVKHGGGVQSLHVRHMFAAPLRALIDAGDLKMAFKVCWGIHEQARESYAAGAHDASENLKRAFAGGRLKKRKMPGRDAHKIWVEPEAQTA